MIMFRKKLSQFAIPLIALLLFTPSCKKDDGQSIPTGEKLSMDDMLKAPIRVKLNPYGRTPLAAELTYETVRPSRLELTVLGQEPVSANLEEFMTQNSRAVLGLYSGMANKVALKLVDDLNNYAIDTISIQTDSLFPALPEIQITTADRDKMEPGMHLAGLHLANHGKFVTHPIFFDTDGHIRYHLDLSDYSRITWPVRRLDNGLFYMGNNLGVYFFDVLGREITHIPLPAYRPHHEVTEMPNGNLLVGVQKYGTQITDSLNSTIESLDDHIIEVSTSGNILHEWDLREILDIDRHDLTNGKGDWFHLNAIWYSKDDDCLIVSGRNQGVIKITRDNELKWIMAPHKGWGKAGADGAGSETNPFLLTAVDANGAPYESNVQQGNSKSTGFDWPWGQHAPMELPNGDIMVFDNGFNRQYGNAGTGYSRAVVYKVDEANMTVREVWSYGENRGGETFSSIISDVDHLPETGHVLYTPGIINENGSQNSKIIEIDPVSNAVIFEAQLNFKNANGTGQISWGEMDIVYRSERMALYP